MKFALATVIYPKVKQFFPEFIKSLRNQTDQNFQILIVNEGCNIFDFDLSGFDFVVLNDGGSISKNREILIHEADKLQYEWIVFADADDWFEANRIEIIRSLILEYDIIANEIVPFSGRQYFDPKFQRVLGKFQQIDLNFVFDKNLFGLSNVACRTRFLKDIFIPSEIIAVDWYQFTKAIQSGAKACFTAKTKTYYRQWAENIIGMDKITDKEINTGVQAKYFHYKYLINTDPWYKKNLPWINKIYLQIKSSEFDSYIDKVRKSRQKTTFWWENIKDYDNE